MSPTPDATFADPQQTIAELRRELAQRTAELNESEDQKAAAAEVLEVINSSPGDLVPVFDAILERAIRLCDGITGALWTFDGELGRLAATRGLSAEFVWLLRGTAESHANVPLERVLAGERLIEFPDILDDELYRAGDPVARAAIAAGLRSLIWVAMVREGVACGAFAVGRPEVRPFTDKEIALLQNFAAQAVIAMENARLITETREALEQQTATAEVLSVINSSPGDLAPVFNAILEKAVRLCRADAGNVYRLEDGVYRQAGNYLVPDAYREIEANLAIVPGRDTLVGRVAIGAAPVQIVDVQSDPEYGPKEEARIGRAETMLGVPLLRDGVAVGVFGLGRGRVEAFSDREIALVTGFAAQAVIAMENARLLGELRQRTEEVVDLNRGLEARVAEQVEELGRVGRLKRFLAPQLAELIVSQGDEKILESHRREIVVVFCDLRGYTGFTETAEPEEVLDFLREYHGALGPLVSQFEGTLDQFSGDGIMVFFNDPVPISDPGVRAVNMAVAMREAAGTLIAHWRERGRDMGFGVGIAQGYATLGQIGFSERSGYTAIGTVCNVAARLCAEAKDGQILLSQRVNVALKGSVATEQVGALALKGLTQPVVAYNVPLSASQPALRVIEGGSPQSV